MQLSKHLVLFRYLLRQFGFDSFDKLRDEYADKLTGYDTAGRSFFVNMLLARPRQVPEPLCLHYDEVIKGYEDELVRRRSEPFLSLKYYQYFSLLFTEYYLDEYANRPQALLDGLNRFRAESADFSELTPFEPKDLKKLAYWMATGSGKTLLMHVNYRQMMKYFPDWLNILLVTPNEGLSQQHYDEFRKSGIKAKLYSGSEQSLKTQPGEVLILEITKLTGEKKGEGVSVDVSYFSEDRNLVFIDEGHKGQRSEEKAWKKLREALTQGEHSFTFEYSATFGQIIGKADKDLLDEYGKAILFDYSYRHFYADGYGKDFSVFNIQSANGYSERQTQLLLTGSLLGFYEQMVVFEKYEDELRAYNIEKPLWVFVGSKVVGGKGSLTKTDQQNVSDVSLVLNFFRRILAEPKALQQEISNILEGKSGLVNRDGEDIFKNRFQFLKSEPPVAEDILNKVFHGAGSLEALKLRQAEGEIGLRSGTSQQYFGVVNIGDVPKYGKKLEEDTGGEVRILEDHFSPSLFHSISQKHSGIHVLIGSKKFIEGWNSWRVSSMGLMNMGRGEGAQIIQLFGRGVRLKGKGFSLKREESTAPYRIRALQTISIFGLNADYVSNFLTTIEKEIDHFKEYEVPIRLNRQEAWENKIFTFRTENREGWKDKPLMLEVKDRILQRIHVDLRPKVAVASGGFNSHFAEAEVKYNLVKNPLHQFGHFLDYDEIYLAANRFKQVRNFHHLVIRSEVLRQIVQSQQYDIKVLDNQFGIADALTGKLQNIAISLVKDYIGKFCADKEKDYLTANLSPDFLSYEKHRELFPEKGKLVIKAPERKAEELEKLLENLEQFYTLGETAVPSIHFDRHLYSPLAVYNGKKGRDIKTMPVKLNEGESDFIRHLMGFLPGRYDGKEIFVLRNLSKRGVGFFVESSSFFPDFIIWIAEEKKQTILFVDPKGILMMGNLNDDKVIFCRETIREINAAVQRKLKAQGSDLEVVMRAYILSVTPYLNLKSSWGEDKSEQDFTNSNILFLNERKEYLMRMFGE